MKQTILLLFAILFITIALTAEVALFSVTNNSEPPDTVFAVYPSGIKVLGEDGVLVMIANRDSVRLYIDENVSRSSRGGFAIGGVASRDSIQDYFLVSPDSTRVYFNELPSRSSRGGFAIGGVASRNVIRDYFSINPDSTRINVKDSDKGFSVGNIQAEGTNKFLDLTSTNSFLGHKSGVHTTTGYNNLFLGHEAGYNNTTGNNNTFLGNKSGYDNTEGFHNVYIGDQAGYTSGFNPENGHHNYRNVFIGGYSGYSSIGASSNVFVGYGTGRFTTTGLRNSFFGNEAGYENDDANDNSFFGDSAGHELISGHGNSFFGSSAGRYNQTDYRNSFFGSKAGYSLTDGGRNIFLGAWSGQYRETGDYNTFVGFGSGQGSSTSPPSGNYNVFLGYESGKLTEGDGNVFLGKQTGSTLTSSSNTLIIDNSSTISPLIHGDFYANEVVIDGNSEDNSSNRTFFVNGSAGGNTAWNNESDENLKEDINTISNALEKVQQLRGVNFRWKDPEKYEEGMQMGFLAQEVEKVIPETVDNTNGHYTMKYAPVNALLVEAIKEQQKLINLLKDEIEELKSKFNKK